MMILIAPLPFCGGAINKNANAYEARGALANLFASKDKHSEAVTAFDALIERPAYGN